MAVNFPSKLQRFVNGPAGDRFTRQFWKRARHKVRQLAHGNVGERQQQLIGAEVERALAVPQGAFPARLELPPRFGLNLPERVPEILLARLSYRPGAKVLDIGHANAGSAHRAMLLALPAPRHITGIDIAAPTYDTTPYYEHSVHGDVAATDVPLPADFDLIWCISSIEHFGLDNSAYVDDFHRDANLDAIALGRMLELLRPGGQILVTVPFGKAANHGWMRVYDLAQWQTLLQAAPGTHVDQWFWAHSRAGWKLIEPRRLSRTMYYDQPNSGAAGMAAALITKQ